MGDQFRMLIANIYSLRDGVAVPGRIESGVVRIGDSLKVVSATEEIPVKVLRIEYFQRAVIEAQKGTKPVGIVLQGIEHDQIRNRDLLLGGTIF
jgi:translation elongation factor EF-Tu-like GTPase